MEAKILDEKANAVLLAMALYPDQALFSKKPLRKLEDFKGVKTRVHSVALASLIAGLGGEPLTIAFAEVYTALERGTLDAAVSGTKPGYGLRWYEVSKYLVGPISMRPHVALAINKNTWKRLPPDMQNIMKEEAEKIVEAKAFDAIEMWNTEGIDKNVEKGMEHLPFSPELQAAIKEVLRTKVVPDWIKRAGDRRQRSCLTKLCPSSGVHGRLLELAGRGEVACTGRSHCSASLAFCLLLGTGGRAPAVAQPAKSEFTLKLMGINRAVPQYRVWEEWAQTVEKRTNGRVKFEFTSLPELGFGGLKRYASPRPAWWTLPNSTSGTWLESCPWSRCSKSTGLFSDQPAMEKAFQAWKPHLVKLIDEKVNGVLLATAFASNQFLFSKKPVRKRKT